MKYFNGIPKEMGARCRPDEKLLSRGDDKSINN